MTKKLSKTLALALTLLAGFGTTVFAAAHITTFPDKTPPMPVIEGNVIKNTTNLDAVRNGANKPFTFTINTPHRITYIYTYHWNNQKGMRSPGTISLRAQNGTVYGPWQAYGDYGSNRTPNAYWKVYPDIVIPAGTYELIDSDPSTWSQNRGSGGVGHAEIWGMPAVIAVIEGNVIKNTTNLDAVRNGARQPFTFSISTPHRITYINTYHWNNQKGMRSPGTISLRAQNGTVYGPWQAVGDYGMYQTPNAYWKVYPDIVIPAGAYELIDSDPSTWSQNIGSDGVGHAEIWGVPAAARNKGHGKR